MDRLLAYFNKYKKYILFALAVFVVVMVVRWLIIDYYTSKLFSYFRDFDNIQEQPLEKLPEERSTKVTKKSEWITPYIAELEKMRAGVMHPLAPGTDSPHKVFIQERIDEQYMEVGMRVVPQYPDDIRLRSYELVKPYAEMMDKGLNYLMQCSYDIETGVTEAVARVHRIAGSLEKAQERAGTLLLRKNLDTQEKEELAELQHAIDTLDGRELNDDRDIILEQLLDLEPSCREDIKVLWPVLAADGAYVREYMPLLARHNIEEYYYIIGKM